MQGHITQRSSGSWAIVLDLDRGPDGRRRQQWLTVKGTKRDAQRELRALLSARDNGLSVEPNKMTVAMLVTKWLAEYASARCSPKTVERYGELARLHLVPMLGHYTLESLRPLHIQEMLTQMQKRLSNRTCLHAYRLMSQMLAQAVKWQLLARNVCDAVEAPKPVRPEMKILDSVQLNALLEQTKDSRLHIPIVLAATCGLRRGEILALRWSDVDLEARMLRVTRSLEETRAGLRFKGTKSGRGRQVALMGLAVSALRHHRAEQASLKLQTGGAYNSDDLVAPGLTGETWRPSVMTDSFSRLMKRLDVAVTFHGLRHSHASLGLAAGCHPKVMSERLGHATVGITLDVYSHVVAGLQEQAVEVMEQALMAGKLTSAVS